MKIILISAVLLQITYSYAYPASQGVASFAYQDSAGNRYGGTYDLNNKLVKNSDLFTPFNDVTSFYPNYFTNYDNLIQPDVGVTRSPFRPFRRMRRPSRRIFGSDYESQRLASYAARKAYDLTYNHWPINQNFGYSPTFFRFGNFGGGFPFFGPGAGLPNMDSISRQSAFASAALGPGFSHQMAAIDPINIDMPNIDVTSRFSDADRASGKPQFYSVSSSSFASSANDNGKVTGYRGAETVVNNNGKVTKYKVES